MPEGGDRARVLVYAPIGRDGPASAELLLRAGLAVHVCGSARELIACVQAEAATVLVAEEGLFGEHLAVMTAWVERQPAWSDLPFVVLTSHHAHAAVSVWRRRMVDALRNVSLLERPVQAITLTTTVHAAVRARQRQFEVRALLESRERNAIGLENLVLARTRQLEAANRDLRDQMAERARVEETLRQAQKMEALGQLTGGVAHDFNNLLMVISGGLDMLRRQPDPERRQRLMDGMRQAVQRGAGLTRQLLAFSRRQPLEPKPIDLARQMNDMRELLDRSLRGDVHVTLSFPDPLWTIEVDPGELELVVLNLAVNARDAMPDGGTIDIRAENLAAVNDGDLKGDYVCLSIIDSGTGMTPEVKARVFEPFFTTKEIGKGSGLGLAQVYGFAKQSGGAVRIDSELGRGTRVMIFLPRSAKVLQPAAGVPGDTGAARRHHDAAGHILLVEDDDEVAALVSEMLGQLGYDVTRTASAAAALGALANNRSLDAVFSDVMMPGGMSGVELAREVRAWRHDLPILLTSGYAEAVAQSADAAGVRVLPKPYRLDELAAALKLALDGRDSSSSVQAG